MVTHAIILAGGKGERLKPLTDNKHKGMIDMGGKPMTLWQIEQFKKNGVTNFVLAVSYKHEVTEAFFGDGSKFGVKIGYSLEEQPLGRGGAIKKAWQHPLIKDQSTILVANGDIMTDVDLLKMAEFHTQNQALTTMLLVPYQAHYDLAQLDEENHIIKFDLKPFLPYWVNAGIYILDKVWKIYYQKMVIMRLKPFPSYLKISFLDIKAKVFGGRLIALKT
jgi:NDP-sugar pyrophosphorylase family protein